MKRGAIVTAGLLLLFVSAAGAWADSIPPNDPRIIIGAGSGSADIITPNFTIFSPTGTSPGTSPCTLIQGPFSKVEKDCVFENSIGAAITGLDFVVGGVNASSVTCQNLANSAFSGCEVQTTPNGVDVGFFGGSIPDEGEFQVQLLGFPANTDFNTTASLAPEPATIALVLSGLGGLLTLRKRRA